MLLIRDEIPDLEKDSINITLQEYFDFAKAGIEKAIDKPRTNDDSITVINGNDAMSCEITGRYAGLDIYYRLTVVSDETYFYQILFWTTREQKSMYKTDFVASIESFKPL